MKVWYDKKAWKQNFKPNDKVLVILPIPGNPLQARFCGPYMVERKVNDVDYIVDMPERCKKRGYVISACSRSTMLTAVHPLHHICH